MFVALYRKTFFTISALLVVASIVAMFVYGFNFGIDFKGGALLEVSYPQMTDGASSRPELEAVQTRISALNMGGYSVRPSGDDTFVVRTKELSPEEKNKLMEALSVDKEYPPKEERFNSIGPVVGKELKNKAFVALAVVIIGIVLFVTFAFRKVSEPVSSWKYGLVTILALVHDVIVPTGVYIVFSHIYGGEIDMYLS